MISIVKDSHVDHGLSKAQLDWLLDHFKDKTAFFIETVTLPEKLGTVECGLHGPAAGTPEVQEGEVSYGARLTREWASRLCKRPKHATRLVTIIAGIADAYKEMGMVLWTAYGGPPAPQEPGDPDCKNLAASVEFWNKHALSE